MPRRRTVHRKVHRKRGKMALLIPVKGWNRRVDAKLVALHPGKRRSKGGKTYYEYRINRADKSRKLRL